MPPRPLTLQDLANLRLPRLDPDALPLDAIRERTVIPQLLSWVAKATRELDPRLGGSLEVPPPPLGPVRPPRPDPQPPRPVEPQPGRPVEPPVPLRPSEPGRPPRRPPIEPEQPPRPRAILASFGPFSLDLTPGRVVVKENGTDKWTIAAADFDGQPTVEATATPEGADIALRDAFYPGTTIPASLKARIRQVNGVWQIRLRLDFGHFDATAPLGPWINRAVLAVSLVHPSLECCPLGTTSALKASGFGLAGFTPDWLLPVIGLNLFTFDGFDGPVTSDVVLIARLPPGGPTFYFPQNWRRTVVLCASFDGFPLQPVFAAAAPRVHLGHFRFQSLTLEAGIEPGGGTYRLLFAQAPPPAPIGFEPGADLRGSDGEPFRLPLHSPRHAELYDQARYRMAALFAGEVSTEPFWMHAPGVSLQLARHPDHLFAGMVENAPNSAIAFCVTNVVATAPRVGDVLVRPEAAPRRAEMRFGWQASSDVLPDHVGRVEIDAAAGAATLLLPLHTSLAFVRRDDFMALRYEWPQMRFRSRGTDRRLLHAGNAAPRLVIEFPPQSIGEETFFEADPSYKVDDSDMDDDPQSGNFKQKAKDQESAAGALPAPPVKALLAKTSRLVFGLPPGTAEYPIAEDTLLGWSQLPPALATTALPGAHRLVVSGKPPILLPAPEILVAEPRFTTLPALGRAIDARAAVRHTTSIIPSGRTRSNDLTLATKPSGNLRPVDTITFPPHIILKPSPPSPTTTAIELPFRLLLSPNKFGTWIHALAPVTRGDRTELWHTRLATRIGDSVTEDLHPYRTVRAIWSRDHDIGINSDRPYLMPLDQDDRRQIVDVTSDFSIGTPTPVAVKHLMLSSLGGWLDSDLRLDPPPNYAIEQWRHRATMGRDHFVRVVYKGFLFPFGHRVSLVKISERKIQQTPDGDPAAYLRMRMFIVVREPERTYLGPGYLRGGRETPFKRVRITTLVTPNLNPPKESMLAPGPNDTPLGAPVGTPFLAAFWPRVGATDFHFHLKAWDWENHEIDFLMPLAFVRSDLLDNAAEIATAVAAYNDDPVAERRTTSIGGQQVAFADATGFSGKTTFDTASAAFVALAPANNSTQPPCYPRLHQAQVSVAALRQMTGVNTPATIELDPHYLEHAFDAVNNMAGLFARVPPAMAAPALDFRSAKSADRSGGVATPSVVIRGLSREIGTVGDTSDDLAQGTFKPQQFFGGVDAQLLGGISLSSVLDELLPADFLSQAPKLVTKNAGDELLTTLSWHTQRLKTSGPFEKRSGSELFLDSILRTPKAGGAQTFQLQGRLVDFAINLADVIILEFDLFRFTSVDGKKPDVHVEVRDIRFAGALEFVNTLQPLLSPENFADPPFLEVSPVGITAGYGLTIPSVGVGVFSLQNLALGARLSLPFTGEPMRVRFNFCERQSPFIVSVGPFGGGGFFAIAVGVDGVEVLEASIEFGGNISIDLGVASGGIYLMAGIYLRIEVSANVSELTGYVRAGGALSVLGIVTISIEFYLGLTYDFGNGKAWGEASVTVEIDVLLFSGSVTVRMRRQFKGSTGDPPFGVLMPQPRWAAYAAAFA